VTNRKDTVKGQTIDSGEGPGDGEAVRWKTDIERGIGEQCVEFKVGEGRIGADGLNGGSSWGEPGGKGDGHREN